MTRTHYLVLTTAGLTVAAAAAGMFGGAKLTASAAPNAFTRAAVAVRLDAARISQTGAAAHTLSRTVASSTEVPGASGGAGGSAGTPHEQRSAQPGMVLTRSDNQRGKSAATSVPDPRAFGVFALGLLVTAGRLSIEERRRASAPGLPTHEGAATAR